MLRAKDHASHILEQEGGTSTQVVQNTIPLHRTRKGVHLACVSEKLPQELLFTWSKQQHAEKTEECQGSFNDGAINGDANTKMFFSFLMVMEITRVF